MEISQSDLSRIQISIQKSSHIFKSKRAIAAFCGNETNI